MYSIEYYPEAEGDLESLPDDVLTEALDYIEKFKTDPYAYSQPLYKQGERDLRGYRKTYIACTAYRIVLRVENNTLQIVSIVAVGPRDNMQVYNDAFSRTK